MPEGDTIFRAARGLHRALAGRTITRFESVFARLTRADGHAPLRGRTIERVEARGKHLLIWLSGGLVLHTHLRMHGSWHLYRTGERWKQPAHRMRIVLEAGPVQAVAFDVPTAELLPSTVLARTPALRDLGPDPLDEAFDAANAVARIVARPDMAIADVLLDQRAIAGIGNIYKSEALFAARIHPFALVRDLDRARIARLVTIAARLLRLNVTETDPAGATPPSGARRTTGRSDPGSRYWVYRRGGKPCRRCGTVISSGTPRPGGRLTYWCARCQPAGGTGPPGGSQG